MMNLHFKDPHGDAYRADPRTDRGIGGSSENVFTIF